MSRTYLLCSILMSTLAASLPAQNQPAPTNPRPARSGLTLTSPAFADGGVIPAQPASPKLEWKNVLPDTASFVLIMHDVNTSISKTGEDVLHWMVFNIPSNARELPANLPIAAELPDGSIQGVSRGGENGYRPFAVGGEAPHHYVFDLYALDIKLSLGPKATRVEVLKAMDGHVVEKGALIGRNR